MRSDLEVSFRRRGVYRKLEEKGLQLYTKNVFIMDKCKELVPDHFRFVKGLVDSSDFSLIIIYFLSEF